MPKSAGATVLMILLGGILGGYLGELLGLLAPAGFLHELFTKGFSIGFDSPLVLNLRVVVLTLGFKVFVNLLGIAGMVTGLYYAK